VARGVDGVVVSNHGGRQLDGAAASIDALPAVVDAVEGRISVLLDGGIRRGVDVVKALSVGAAACLIGRPQLWGLAVAGEAGVAHVLTEGWRSKAIDWHPSTGPTALGPGKTLGSRSASGMPQGDYEALLEAARLIIAAREADKRRQPKEAARLRERVKRLLPGFAQTVT